MLQSYLSSFCCEKDADIESFLRTRAVSFEKLSKSRTYLILDEDQLDQGEFVILGYFTLALKVLIIPVEKSINMRTVVMNGCFLMQKEVSSLPPNTISAITAAAD